MSFVNTTLIPQVSSVPGMEWLQNAITSQAPPNIQQILTSGLVRTLVSAPISAGVNSLLTGADFGQGLLVGLQSGFASNVLQPGLMNIVGDFGVANNLQDGGIEKVLLHAGVGALGGLIMGGGRGALGGALGAGLNELALPFTSDSAWQKDPETGEFLLDQNGNRIPGQLQNISQLLGGIGSLLAGDGSMAGATSALNGTNYNFLSHEQIQDLRQQLQDCGDDAACKQRVSTEFQATSSRQNAALAACADQTCRSSYLALFRTVTQDDKRFLFGGSIGADSQVFSSLWDLQDQAGSAVGRAFEASGLRVSWLNQALEDCLGDVACRAAAPRQVQQRIDAFYAGRDDRAAAVSGILAGTALSTALRQGATGEATLSPPDRTATRLAPAENTATRPDFYVASDGTIVPATGYRAIGGSDKINEAIGGLLPARPDGTYMTFNNISNLSATEVQSLLQLPRTPEGYVRFDTRQILGDLTIPNGNWGRSTTPEPITSTMPQWGAGDGTQAITNSQIVVDGYWGLKK